MVAKHLIYIKNLVRVIVQKKQGCYKTSNPGKNLNLKKFGLKNLENMKYEKH